MQKAAVKGAGKPKALAKEVLKGKSKRHGIKLARHFVIAGGNLVKAVSKKRSRSRRPDVPLPFYAMVTVKRRQRIPPEARGREGVVVGRVQTRAGGWNYSVTLRDLEDSYYLPHSALTATGVVLKREALYGGEKLRVQVNASGAGTEIVE